jgi:DNA primase
MRIPPAKIEEIRVATDIVDLIGSFVRLKKRGKNYLGLCPFHTEKTPSFNVSADRQMYHCFGCGAGGNAFTFVMEYEKVSFVEAVRGLAEKAGIALPSSSEESDREANEQEQLYEACRCAADFFRSSLATAEGKVALDYLHKRGFTDETIKTFQIGYAPNSWDAFVKYAASKKIPVPTLEKAGLVRKRDDGSAYDYFRGRAIFPVFSTTGRIVGFGARKLMQDDQLGKYINSPETPIYQKSKILYGLYQAREPIREEETALLVEGYADQMRLFQAGVKNVVASSGTALTEEQITLLSRYAKNVTIVYDADSAGSKAALRGVDLILERDLDVKVAALPEGEDPDSFIGKEGGDAFRKLAKGAGSFIDFIAGIAQREGRLASPEGKAQTVRSIVQSISKMPDELKRSFYVKHVADQYKLYESSIHRELEKILTGARRGARTQMPAVPAFRDGNGSASPPPVEVPPAERDLTNAMLSGGVEVARYIFSKIEVDDFTHPQTRAVAGYLYECIEEGKAFDPSLLLNDIKDPALRRLMTSAVVTKHQLSRRWTESQLEQANPMKLAGDALELFLEASLQRRLAQNHQSLEEASRRGADVMPFLEAGRDLRSKIKELRSGGIHRDS